MAVQKLFGDIALMKSFISQKIKKKRSHAGFGLFAITDIQKGERIVDFSTGTGSWIDTKQADALYDAGNDYIIQTDDNLFFAAANDAELEDADFINHSCDPNCGIRGSLEIVAMRDIAAGEEITFDYAMSESSDLHMECSCSSAHCRRVITGDDWKIPALQEKYAQYFSDYLKQKIRRKEYS